MVNSLRSKREFDYLYRDGYRVHDKYFILYIKKIDSLLECSGDRFRLGLSVSKKIGNAVERNLIKRRVRAICREEESIFFGFALIFVAKTGVEGLTYIKLKVSILDSLNRALQNRRYFSS